MKLRYLSSPFVLPLSSPPSRGAWIEIYNSLHNHPNTKSPPSRGAWIEIKSAKANRLSEMTGRPPRGGRGLKLCGIGAP